MAVRTSTDWTNCLFSFDGSSAHENHQHIMSYVHGHDFLKMFLHVWENKLCFLVAHLHMIDMILCTSCLPKVIIPVTFVVTYMMSPQVCKIDLRKLFICKCHAENSKPWCHVTPCVFKHINVLFKILDEPISYLFLFPLLLCTAMIMVF